MNFTKLKDRIDTLPLILAGPMVRRVEPAAATVWVALRRRRRIRLEIYDGDAPNGQVVARGESETVAVGANLHMACVTASPSAPFTAGKTYQYNLFFDHLGGSDDIQNGADLFGPRIVSASDLPVLAEAEARNRLTYASDGGPPRPSFVLPPPSLGQVRLLHGSCRKVSGPHNDALEAADHILRDAFTPTGQRPHMLFLTGDNIYNDGCAPESFEVILDAAPVLLGWDESIVIAAPLVTRFSTLSEPRWDYSLDDAGLSSPGADLRQLFGLGEVIALHLLTFADVLWPEDLDYQSDPFDFRGSLPAVRRALANVATYMTFDDHEFSNSWNLTADWVESVLDRTLGRRIYQDALAAYALCQGWGNTPDQFEAGAGKTLLDAIVAWSEAEIAGTASPAAPLAQISKSTGLPDVDAFRSARDWSGFHGPDVVRWDYSVPCPGLNIDVLDTYMWRAYEGRTANAIILSEAALNQQIHQAPPDTECSLIVVSNVAITLPGGKGGYLDPIDLVATRVVAWLFLPLWVIGRIVVWILSIFTSIPSSLPSLYSLIRASGYEPEYGSSYEHQTKGFELLMAHAAHRAPQQLVGGKRQARAVFISGDAHQSFCMRMEYWSRVPFSVTGDPVEAVLAQLVGSPCKWVNPTRYELKDSADHHWAGWRDEPTLTWTTQPDKSPWRFKKSPWMMGYVPTASEPRMNPDPEWRYLLQPIMPVVDSMEILNRPNPTKDQRIAEMKQVAEGLIRDFGNKTHVLKVNNLADVTFKWTPGSKEVIQNVWWRPQPSVVPEWTISRFVVSMEPPAAPPRLPQ